MRPDPAPLPAPDFALPDARGIVHSLEEFLSRGPLLLAFHRGTW